MDWDKFINIWLVFANLLMALETFIAHQQVLPTIQ